MDSMAETTFANRAQEPRGEVGGLSPGSHAAYIFNDAIEKQRRLFRLCSEALQDSWTFVLYIAGKQGVKGIRLSLKDYGIDVASYERLRKFRLEDSIEWYLNVNKQGSISSFKPSEELRKQFIAQVSIGGAAGRNAMMVISETDMLVRKGFFPAYLEFERELGRNNSMFNATFICAYDERELNAAGVKKARQEIASLHSETFE